MRSTGVDIQIQGQFGRWHFMLAHNPMLRKRRGLTLCGKNYNSNNRVRIKILVKLQRVYERMTWLGEAMKDGVSTDMPRGAANWL